MARIARVVVPGVPHHVTQRGNRRLETFFNDGDYRAYIDLLAALSAGRYNPKLAAFRQRLLDKGRAPKAALIAVARRLLTILNALVRSGQSWNPEHA